MTTNIINFPIDKTLRHNLPVDPFFNQAKSVNLTRAIIVGYTQDDKFFFSASENVTNEEALFLLKCGEKFIFDEVE